MIQAAIYTEIHHFFNMLSAQNIESPSITVPDFRITFYSGATVFQLFSKNTVLVLHVKICFVNIGVVLVDILVSQKCFK